MRNFLIVIIIILLGFIGYQNATTWIEKQKEEVKISAQKEVVAQCNQYIQNLINQNQPK